MHYLIGKTGLFLSDHVAAKQIEMVETSCISTISIYFTATWSLKKNPVSPIYAVAIMSLQQIIDRITPTPTTPTTVAKYWRGGGGGGVMTPWQPCCRTL